MVEIEPSPILPIFFLSSCLDLEFCLLLFNFAWDQFLFRFFVIQVRMVIVMYVLQKARQTMSLGNDFCLLEPLPNCQSVTCSLLRVDCGFESCQGRIFL